MVRQLVKCPVQLLLLLLGGLLLPHLLLHLTCPTELHQDEKEKAGNHSHVALALFGSNVLMWTTLYCPKKSKGKSLFFVSSYFSFHSLAPVHTVVSFQAPLAIFMFWCLSTSGYLLVIINILPSMIVSCSHQLSVDVSSQHLPLVVTRVWRVKVTCGRLDLTSSTVNIGSPGTEHLLHQYVRAPPSQAYRVTCYRPSASICPRFPTSPSVKSSCINTRSNLSTPQVPNLRITLIASSTANAGLADQYKSAPHAWFLEC